MATIAAVSLPQTRVSALRLYSNEVRFGLLGLSRNRGYTLSIMGFPVLFYLLFAVTNKNEMFQGHTIARYLLAGYSCFGAMGSALFGIGVGFSLDRNNGWLELKRASPMPALAYLVAKLVVSIIFAACITLLLMGLGIGLAGVHLTVLEAMHLLTVMMIGVLPFASLGLLIGLLMPANAAPGVINLIYLPMSFCGGLWMPIEALPHWLQIVAHGMPSYWLARVALQTLGYTKGYNPIAWLLLGAYTVLFLLTAGLIFRRQESQA
jgi:ABC-2 type transport system permease protein